MHNSHHGPPDTSKGYEQSDLSIPGIVKGVVFYFIFTGAVAVVVLVYLLIIGFAHDKKGEELGIQRIPAAPNPLLQNNTTARTDLWMLRARENYLLTTPSYVDDKHTTARIPIDEAIDKAAAMGPAGLKPATEVGIDPRNTGVVIHFGGDPRNPPVVVDDRQKAGGNKR
jgi:hypothetical protein